MVMIYGSREGGACDVGVDTTSWNTSFEIAVTLRDADRITNAENERFWAQHFGWPYCVVSIGVE
jgi:hypothetical protein